jgi:hypothetical protein
MHSNRGGIVGGLILILLGLGFLVQQAFPDYFSGWLFLVGLALIFLVAYIATRQYGYLIPGCILMGLGIPLAVVQIQTSQMGWYVSSLSLDEGGLVVLGLGLGFVAIYVIDLLVSRGRPGGWWPLIPGGIVTLAGLAILSQNEQWLDSIGMWWPVIFIIIGCWIIVDRLIRRPR